MSNATIAGKPSNTIGDKDAQLVLRGSSVKILWGNKFIDLIKNGKINVESEKIFRTINSVDDIKDDGIYLIDDKLWISVNGVTIKVAENFDDTYISFIKKLTDVTPELKLIALNNIGFYYLTIEEALNAGLTNGIIYIQETNKLYNVNQGIFTEYSLFNNQIGELYINKDQLYVENSPYSTYRDNKVTYHKKVVFELGLYSNFYSDKSGFGLYIKDSESYLEVDNIIERNDILKIKHRDLIKLIEEKKLEPTKQYVITDFLNPWEISTETEKLYYQDVYDGTNVIRFRNASRLLVRAINETTLEKSAKVLEHPEWDIEYDVTYLGPKQENDLYGYRKVEGEYLPCKGQITYLKDEYGNEGDFNFRLFRFKYTSKESGNSCWRYCIDIDIDYEKEFTVTGEFANTSNNKFFIKKLETYSQVFSYNDDNKDNPITIDGNQLTDNGNTLTGCKLLLIFENENENKIINNTFRLSKVEKNTIYIKSDNIIDNTIENVYANININNKEFKSNIFIDIIPEEIIDINISENSIVDSLFKNINGDITITKDCNKNKFENLKKGLDIKEIRCSGNVIINFDNDDENCKITGTEFDNNTISNIKYNIENNNIFTNNTITDCYGIINNNGTFDNNNIVNCSGIIKNSSNFLYNTISNISINKTIENSSDFSHNIIYTCLENITNSNIFTNNIINICSGTITNSGTIHNNTIDNIQYLSNTAPGIILDNTIDNIKTLTNTTGNIHDNKILSIDDLNVTSEMCYNDVKSLTGCEFNKFENNKASEDLTDVSCSEIILYCIFDQPCNNFKCKQLNYCTISEINNLDIGEVAVWYTTFHGKLGDTLTHEIEDVDIALLEDDSKKKEAYPNIIVMCIPEIYVPGMIMMWYDTVEKIPKGWRICNGKNGTPNLIDKFIKGGLEKTDKDNGKSNSIKLELKHLPYHTHPHTHTVGINETIETLPATVEFLVDSTTYSASSNKSQYLSREASNDILVNILEKNPLSLPTSNTHSHSIELNLQSETSKPNDEQQTWDNEPIDIEPAGYSLIFIMREYPTENTTL